MKSFRSVIELWDSREAMAADLGVKSQRVSKWWQRDNIPSELWAGLIETQVARSAGVSAELLTALAAREPIEARA